MAYRITRTGSDIAYNVKELVCETLADMPTDVAIGSIAYCLEDKNFYILDFNKAWVVM